MKEKLSRLIQRWMGVRVLGLDIEASRLNYAEVVPHNGALVLRQGGTLLVGEGGKKEALEKLASRIVPSDINIACAFSCPELIVNPFRFPRISQKEFPKAIRMEAEAAILEEQSLDEMVIDWHRTGPVSGEEMEGILAVAPRSMITGCVDMLQKAGVRPAIIDIKALALWNAFWKLTPGIAVTHGPVLLINTAHDAIDLIIAQGGQGLFLVRDLEIDVHATMSEWLSEIRDSLDYAYSTGGLKKLEAAYITGSGAQESLAEALASAIGLHVPIWNPFHYLQWESHGSNLVFSEGHGMSVAVGLALRNL